MKDRIYDITRTIQRKGKYGGWEDVDYDDLEINDIVRMFEDTGEPVIDNTNPDSPWSVFKLVSLPRLLKTEIGTYTYQFETENIC